MLAAAPDLRPQHTQRNSTHPYPGGCEQNPVTSCAAHETETRETATATVGCSAVLSSHAVANRFTTNGKRTKQLVELAIADQFGDAHPRLGPVVAPAYKRAFDLHRRPVGPSQNGRPYLRCSLLTAGLIFTVRC